MMPVIYDPDDDEDLQAFFIDTDNDVAYWIDGQLMSAPIWHEMIDFQSASPVDFETIGSNVDYFSFVVDQLKAA
jgi:hypothetical protein